jgi:hypothetical protein
MARDQIRSIALNDPATHAWGKFIVSGSVKGQRTDGLIIGPYGAGQTTQGYVLLQNSPFTKTSGNVNCLAIPTGRSGDMTVYDYGVPVKGPPAPAKSTNAVPVAKP